MNDQTTFERDLEYGAKFQDYLTDQLFKIGICLNNYTSKEYQINKGENRLGLEIKHDGKYKTTGNLYIEVEAVNKKQTQMIGGGITKEDKSWLYLIGDEDEIFLFGKKQLLWLYNKVKSNEPYYQREFGIKISEHIDKDTGITTSRGMCLPINKLDDLGICLRRLKFRRN